MRTQEGSSEVNDISTTYGSPFNAIRKVREDGSEYWSARDLMPLLGYDNWQNFAQALDRAKLAVEAQGNDVTRLFTDASKKTAGRPQADVELTRFAAYQVAMCGDPRKPEVAAALAYFAIRTREAETRPAFDPAALSRRDILMMAIDAEDARDREAAARVEAEQRAHALEAPASAWRHMAASAGDYSVSDAAKILTRDPAIKIGRDRLFAYMAAQGWIYRGQDRRRSWAAYQTQVDCRRLVEKAATPYLNQKTGEMELPAPTIRITSKGLAELHKRLGGTEPVATLAEVAA